MATSRSTDPTTRKAGLRAGLAAAVVLGALAVPGFLVLRERFEHRLTKAEYEQTVQAQYATVQTAFLATHDTEGAALAARLTTAQLALRTAADRLEAAEPPKQVEEQNEEIVEGMRAYAGQLDGLVADVRGGRPAAIDRFSAELSDNAAVEKIAEAAEEMKFKGYDLGRIAKE